MCLSTNESITYDLWTPMSRYSHISRRYLQYPETPSQQERARFVQECYVLMFPHTTSISFSTTCQIHNSYRALRSWSWTLFPLSNPIFLPFRPQNEGTLIHYFVHVVLRRLQISKQSGAHAHRTMQRVHGWTQTRPMMASTESKSSAHSRRRKKTIAPPIQLSPIQTRSRTRAPHPPCKIQRWLHRRNRHVQHDSIRVGSFTERWM